MKPMAVFYHCKISGWGIPDPSYALDVVAQQLCVLQASGLADAAFEIHLGINGGAQDAKLVSALAPAKAKIHVHGDASRSELTTQKILQSQWLPGKLGWHVLYHHSKGVTHPWDVGYANWRNRMECVCVAQWSRCVADLASGKDAVGCHWLYPHMQCGQVPFFGGTFWWATSEYLAQLPRLPAATWENRYEAESWIGRRKPMPKIVDYIPGFPI